MVGNKQLFVCGWWWRSISHQLKLNLEVFCCLVYIYWQLNWRRRDDHLATRNLYKRQNMSAEHDPWSLKAFYGYYGMYLSVEISVLYHFFSDTSTLTGYTGICFDSQTIPLNYYLPKSSREMTVWFVKKVSFLFFPPFWHVIIDLRAYVNSLDWSSCYKRTQAYRSLFVEASEITDLAKKRCRWKSGARN